MSKIKNSIRLQLKTLVVICLAHSCALPNHEIHQFDKLSSIIIIDGRTFRIPQSVDEIEYALNSSVTINDSGLGEYIGDSSYYSICELNELDGKRIHVFYDIRNDSVFRITSFQMFDELDQIFISTNGINDTVPIKEVLANDTLAVPIGQFFVQFSKHQTTNTKDLLEFSIIRK